MIRYASLPAGDYAFELYAVNGDGIQQEGVITYGFSISKPGGVVGGFTCC
jgi:hypothetical protein